jgi:CDP-glucose 4,6-dehydratase|tara:strand:+ start:845 stop:1825 length:981 start_codon:yes stop_codon:yes gene_type:complete
MSYKNILVTGGLGILGASLVKKISKNNAYNVYILDRSKNSKKIKVLELDKIKKVKIIKGNFNDYKTVYKVIKNNKIGVVFHLGAITQVIDAYKSPMETFYSNILGTINILESIRNLNKKIILIFSSSDKAYGTLLEKAYLENHQLKGNYPYDVSKSASDLIVQSYVKTYSLKAGIIRSGNIFGPGDLNMDRLVPHVIITALNKKNAILRSNGKLIRDYIFVEDVSNAYFLLMKKLVETKEKLRIYNVGSKENLTVISLVKLITKITNTKEILPIIKNFSKIEIYRQKLNYKKISKELKWFPKFKLRNSLKITIKWYEKNLNFFNSK